MSLVVNQLQCSRGDIALFEGLSFKLIPGQLMWLEGRNGSGKTTLLRTLCGLFLYDKGRIEWQGESTVSNMDTYRQNLLYLGHQNALKHDLNPVENLQTLSRLAGKSVSEEQTDEALQLFGLAGYEETPVRKLSQGQQRRVALSRLLLSDALLWILDEPFVALDVAAVELLQSILVKHVEQGGMVILTTHQALPIAEDKMLRLCLDRYF